MAKNKNLSKKEKKQKQKQQAKKEKKQKQKQQAKKQAKQQKKLQKNIQADLDFGKEMNAKYGIDAPLERLDTARPESVQQLLDESKAIYEGAGDRSQEMTDLVSTMQAGLGGLTAEENQAARERALEELSRAHVAAKRDQAIAQAGSGVRGASAAAQNFFLNRDYMGNQRGLERDLLLDNIAIQDKRRDAFGNFLTGLERDEFGRIRDSFSDWRDVVGSDLIRQDGREQFNLAQGEKELARQEGGLLGWAGLIDARRQTNLSNKLARDSLGKPTQTMIGGGGGGGGGGNPGYAAALENLIKNTYPQVNTALTQPVPEGFNGGGI